MSTGRHANLDFLTAAQPGDCAGPAQTFSLEEIAAQEDDRCEAGNENVRDGVYSRYEDLDLNN